MTQKNVAPSPRTQSARPSDGLGNSYEGALPPRVPLPRLPADPPLSRAQRRELTADRLHELSGASGGEREQLVEELVALNQPVAYAVASRFTGRGVERDDVRQVAVEGLFKSVVRYDPDCESDLLSFAVPTIKGEIRRYFRDHGWMVRPPRRIQELQQRSAQAVERLGHELGHAPTAAEVADELGVSEDEYREAEVAMGSFRVASLDVPLGEGGACLGDLLPDGQDPFEAAQARVMLAPALKRLSPDEVRLLDLRFRRQLTQGEIGRVLGISQAQVSRVLARLLERLREEIAGTEEADSADPVR